MNKQLPPAELIINREGRIYHLQLRPDEIADIILLVGDPGRVPLISQYFDRIEVERCDREFICHTGYLGRRRLSVISTGISTANVDIVVNELDALANIDFAHREVKSTLRSLTMIRVGTAGSLQSTIPLDSFLISQFGIALSNLIQFYPYQPTAEAGAILRAFAEQVQLDKHHISMNIGAGDADLIRHFTRGNNAHSGITLTCPGFYAPQGRNLRLSPVIPDLIARLSKFNYHGHRVVNFEMETAALYCLGGLLGHRCVSISAIVADRVRGEFSTQAKQTVKKLIEFVLTRVEQLPVEELVPVSIDV